MQRLDESVDHDARRFLCGVLSHEARCGEWPLGSSINQFSAYKATANKAEMVESLVNRGWMEILDEPGLRHKGRRRYVATPKGHLAVFPPEKLAPMLPNHPVALPRDPVQFAIVTFHSSFFQRRGRWPNGLERARIFESSEMIKVSYARRREAYADLMADGTFVNVTFLSGKSEQNCYVMPMYSPEYTNKDGWIFYRAPLDKT